MDWNDNDKTIPKGWKWVNLAKVDLSKSEDDNENWRDYKTTGRKKTRV